MANSTSGSVPGKIQDEPETFLVPEIKGDFKGKKKSFQKDPESSLKSFPLVKSMKSEPSNRITTVEHPHFICNNGRSSVLGGGK